MNRDEAHRLLDGLRAGLNVPTFRINAALLATGDLDGYRGEDEDEEGEQIVRIHREAGTWERRNPGLAPATWHEAIPA